MEISVVFQQKNMIGSKARKRSASAQLLMAMQSLDQENPPYLSAVRKFAGGESISVLWMRDLVEA